MSLPPPPLMPAAPSFETIRPTEVIDRRIVAFLIDLVLVGMVSLIGFAPLFDTETTFYDSIEASEAACDSRVTQELPGFCVPQPDRTTVVLFDSGGLPIPLLVHLALWLARGALEGITGATPGKWLLGLRVVDRDGTRIGAARGMLRGLLVPVDGFPYGAPMLLGVLVASNNPLRQRLGDRAARSYVIHARGDGVPVDHALALSTSLPPVRARHPQGMSWDPSIEAWVWADSDRVLRWDDGANQWSTIS